MARRMNFRTLVAESLEAGDAMKFKDVIREKLYKTYLNHQKSIVTSIQEQGDPETSMVIQVESASKSYGGKDFMYDQGVLSVTVPTGQAALNFANYLDENENVDSYEVWRIDETDQGGPTDLEKLVEGDDSDYEFTVYFVTDNVRFESFELSEQMDDEEEDEEDGEGESDSECEDEGEMEEGKCKKKAPMQESFEPIDYRDWLDEVTKVVTFQAGLKKIKLQCPPGQKWNPTLKKCEKMSAAENRKRHIEAIKAARKRAPKTAMMAKKRSKSMAKRVAAGY